MVGIGTRAHPALSLHHHPHHHSHSHPQPRRPKKHDPLEKYPRFKRILQSNKGPIAILLIMSIIMFLLLLIVTCIRVAPIFMTLLLGCFIMSMTFVVTESSTWGPLHQYMHSAREAENRFWSLLASFTALVILFTPDSPFSYLGRRHPWFALFTVMSIGIWVNHRDRRLVSAQMTRKHHIRRVDSMVFTEKDKVDIAKAKVQLVSSCVSRLEYRILVLKPFNQKDIEKQEALIYDTLKDATETELNYILTNVNLSLLFYKVKDHDLLAWQKASLQNRTRLLHLLSIDRLKELHVASRVTILDALMNMRLTAHSQAEDCVRAIIMGTTGMSLTRLKCATDTKGWAQNLHKLVYNDVKTEAVRNVILEHIKREAQVVISTHALPPNSRKILSDVDDTLFSSGGSYPAGCDTSYPHHTLYPGVLTFFKELDHGDAAISAPITGTADVTTIAAPTTTEDRVGNLVFLSARPHVYKDKSEMKSYTLFETLRGKTGESMHTVSTLLAGSLNAGMQMFRGDYTPMALKKYSNFQEYAKLYPEFKFVWVGDNGQGDVLAAEMMYKNHPDAMEATFIHMVQPIHLTPGYVDVTTPAKWKSMKIYFFDTYIDAASQACTLGLLTPSALRRVCMAAIATFRDESRSQMIDMTPEQIDDARQHLNKDINVANNVLQSAGLQPVTAILSDQAFPLEAHVQTAVGTGKVVTYDGIHHIYGVVLDHWTLTHAHPVYVYVWGPNLSWYVRATTGTAVDTEYGTGVCFHIDPATGLHHIRYNTLTLPNAPPVVAYLPPSHLHPIGAAAGDHVTTPFGRGIMEGYRREDHVHIISLHDGTTRGYFQQDWIKTRTDPTPLQRVKSRCIVM